MMRVGSVFSGAGGFDLAFERAGAEIVWSCEIDKAARRVLAKHWPDVPCYEDVRDVTAATAAPIDCLVGGFPCQGVSVAGRRLGLADPRSGLFYEFARLADEFKPTWLLIENVPGLLSSGNRRDMGAILGTLGELGYGIGWRIFDAQYGGLAQRRKRVFIVGHSGANVRAAAEVLFERESLQRDHPPRREAREAVATVPGSSVEVGGRTLAYSTKLHNTHSNQAGKWYEEYTPGLQVGSPPPAVAQPIHYRKSRKAHSVDDYETWEAAEVTNTLNAYENADDARAVSVVAFSSKDYGADATTELAPTLRAMPHDASHANGGGQMAVCYGVSNQPTPKYAEELMPSLDAKASGGGRMEAIAYGLTAQQTLKQATELMPPLSASDGGNGSVVAHELAQPITTRNGDPGVAAIWQHLRFIVRRLTPRECERLQGFPDDHTLVYDAKGKPVADGPRYKQMGNAVAVPCVEWIARRMMQ